MQSPFSILCTWNRKPQGHLERHLPFTGAAAGAATGAVIKLYGARVVNTTGRSTGGALLTVGALVLRSSFNGAVVTGEFVADATAGASIGAVIGASTGANAGGDIGASTGASTGGTTGAATGESFGDGVEDLVGDLVGA
jgi:hypothetical protein